MKRFVPVLVLLASLPLLAGGPQPAAPNNVVIPATNYHYAWNSLVIPAFGDVVGANGTHFRSDVTLVNLKSTPMVLTARFLPQGGGAPIENNIQVDAKTAIRSEDFAALAGAAGLGLGTLVIESSQPDTVAANVYATARIWSERPGATGTVSQALSVLPWGASTGELLIYGIRRDARYRANVGIVNLGRTVASFVVDVSTQAADPIAERYEVTVQPDSMQQVSLTNQLTPLVSVKVTRTAGDANERWIAYGSSVDNVTGDSWSQVGFIRNSPF